MPSGNLFLVGDADQARDVENQRDAAIAQNGCAGEHLDVGMQLRQRLDDGLVVADDLINDEADLGVARRDDDDLLMQIGRRGDFPLASALSIILMAVVSIAYLACARWLKIERA